MSDNQLRLFMERIDRLEEEKKGIGSDIKDVYSEAKSQGYDAKIMRELRKLLKMNSDDRANYEGVLDTYKRAVGLEGLPLGRVVSEVKVAITADTKAVKKMVDETLDEVTYQRAVEVVKTSGKASVSFIQRQLRIGYNSGARLVERMEKEGIVSAPSPIGLRTVLVLP